MSQACRDAPASARWTRRVVGVRRGSASAFASASAPSAATALPCPYTGLKEHSASLVARNPAGRRPGLSYRRRTFAVERNACTGDAGSAFSSHSCSAGWGSRAVKPRKPVSSEGGSLPRSPLSVTRCRPLSTGITDPRPGLGPVG
ncbi:hypothetical protein ACIBJC_06485 [Streptomyces sp. NPDC050509]|uniref:hypothetical protein n=1 Tax=Streptomyces sp. NPDC050509 TaxID=3365620 RepID=UPI003798CFE6